MITRRTILGSAVALGAAIGLHGLSHAAAQEASPVPTRFPRTNHPVIGSWQWTNFPGNDQTISFAIFTADGTYVEAEPGRIVGVGTWRASGERTAELVSLPKRRIALDHLYEPGSVIARDPFVDSPEIWIIRLAIEVDESGNRMNATGTFESQDASGTVIGTDPYTSIGDRMIVASSAAATPAAADQ
jgi:hypothetical protein